MKSRFLDPSWLSFTRLKRPLESLASRVLTIFKGALRLKCLELSHIVVRALVQWGRGFILPTFDRLKQFKLNSRSTKELLELLHVMPHLECLSLNMSELRDYKYDREKPLPLCIGSRGESKNFGSRKR